MEQSKTNYVCGFYFDHTFKQVVLIWKNKPAWQRGKLNGVGGKIEKDELPIAAMQREFLEETGILHNEWTDLVVLTGEDWRVYFFCAIGKVNEFEYVETQEEEEVAKIEVNRLLANDYAHIPNLEWLIPMAMQKLQFPNEVMSFSDSANLQAKCDKYEMALKHIGNGCATPQRRAYEALSGEGEEEPIMVYKQQGSQTLNQKEDKQ
jgi:8-oxo-dGTP diphosphatase